MSDVLTPTEEKVYQYLIEFLAANSYQPSIREIGRQFDIKSTKTVSDVLGSLARKGYIQRNQARSRGLRILGAQPAGTRATPYYARVAAFGPPLMPEYRLDSIVLDRRLAVSDGTFCVRVADDGMEAHGIARGSTVLVNPELASLDGDLVAVRVGHDVVVRSCVQRGADVQLRAASDDHAPIDVLPGDDQVVLGVVQAVFRGVMPVSTTAGDTEAAA
ncbi:MAG TPA: S24 family peptidase [Gemmatimonadaceae bacterium]|nr:S24 family peptidase [Gemmatimonadaceae bacterium]